MGSLVVPVRELLSEPELVMDQWMPLDGALPESQILLRAELKVGERTHVGEYIYCHLYSFITTSCKCIIDRS